MELLTPEILKTWQPFIDEAAAQAKQSTCFKSQRGAVLVKGGQVIGRGWNRPPVGTQDTEEQCRTICRIYTVHAEQIALLDAFKHGHDVAGSTMIHVKFKGSRQVPCKKNWCDQCHKITLEAGVQDWLLEFEKGWELYTAREAYDLANQYALSQLSKE